MTEVPIIQKQSIDFQSKSMDWFLYHRDFYHERAKGQCFQRIETNELT